MKDQAKSKEQLINELNEMRQRIGELEMTNSELTPTAHTVKESLEQIERAKQEWEVTVDSLPQLICLVDEAGHIIRTNRTVELWGLADVVTIKGKELRDLLHPTPPDSADYLEAFLEHAWQRLARGESTELEVEDKTLKRHLHLQIQPMSRQTGRQSKATESFAVVILQDITLRKQAERLKNEFLANISQELQTPLTSIIGYSQMMLTGIEGELAPEILENVQGIHENSQHLLDLINEILDLAELEAGNLTLTQEEVSLDPLLNQIKANHSALLTKKPLTINVDIEPDLPAIMADRLRLNQIINHLVTNAVKFTGEGQVALKAFRQNGWVSIEVQDTGIGINEADLETIFEKFRQVDGSLSRRAKGLGLGLAIIRHLVQLHGGTIDVSSSQVERGTTVTVRLPIEP